MLYHANVRFVARYIPEQRPSGLNCPRSFTDIEIIHNFTATRLDRNAMNSLINLLNCPKER